jgi:PAS domain S-box-containing protein
MNRKILVVDDNIHNSKLIEGILLADKAKYEVFFASDGLEGIDKARKIHPDLILMDMRMPELSGIDCLKVLQEDEFMKEIPVIFITAYKTNENFAEAFKYGAFDYITKPIEINELRSRIEKALSIGQTLQRIREKINKYQEERKILEEKATLTESSPNAFVLIDAKGNLEWANEGFEKLHEIKFEDFKNTFGSNINDIKIYKDFTRGAIYSLQSKKATQVEAKYHLPSGTKKWFQISISPQLTKEGEIIKLIAVESDITLIKNKEEELFKQNRRMLIITERLELA